MTLLARVNSKQNVETDSAATTGGQGNLKYFMNVPWPPVEAALSIYNVSLLVKKQFSRSN